MNAVSKMMLKYTGFPCSGPKGYTKCTPIILWALQFGNAKASYGLDDISGFDDPSTR